MSDQRQRLREERESWPGLSLDQQILRIAAEMTRAGTLTAAEDRDDRRDSYARIRSQQRPGLLRELALWRYAVTDLYLAAEAEPQDHAAAMRCLLQLTPQTAATLR